MNLKSLARPYSAFDGAVTLWYMPYATLKLQIIADAFEKIVPRDQWQHFQTTFIQMESLLVEVEFAESGEQAVSVFKEYWQSRTGDMSANWGNFQYLPDDIYTVFWTGYKATRDAVLAPSAEASVNGTGEFPLG